MVCPRIKNAILPKKDIECAATSFLRVEKGRKETLRGYPPKHPRWSADFLFMKIGGYGIS